MSISSEQMQNEIFYHQSVKILNMLLEKGFISKEQHHQIDLLNRQSFKPSLAGVLP
ncbi:MAG: hypothetical protein FWF80_07785 [Defluviitaleaceae bacterium]|nr:hypothetical protein [Defluviitaleaceae bacterium]